LSTYDKRFKEEAVRLACEVGTRKDARQLGISYPTLVDWRSRWKQYGETACVGSGHSNSDTEKTQRKTELERENAELPRANKILKDALA